jgi:HAE1 family hydrophobic/amphiphilic exporter-1
MTLSLAAVFLPVFFMSGIVGRLLHEFAVTIMVAVVVSGLVSLTLTPLLCARMMKPGHEDERAPGTEWFARAYERGRMGYERSLDWALHHRRAVLGVFLGSLLAAGVLFVAVPKGFLPPDDTGQLTGLTEGAQDISFEAMAAKQTQLVEIIRRNPHVEGVMSFVGIGGSSQTLNNGRVLDAAQTGGHAPERRRDCARTATRTRRGAGHPALPAIAAHDPHRRHDHQGASTSTCCRIPTRRGCTNGPRASRLRCARCRSSRT